jgi:hypothetical protein
LGSPAVEPEAVGSEPVEPEAVGSEPVEPETLEPQTREPAPPVPEIDLAAVLDSLGQAHHRPFSRA